MAKLLFIIFKLLLEIENLNFHFELHFEWNLLFFNFELVARNENFIFQLWVDNSKVEK